TREKIRPYVTELMKQAHEKGTPLMRPLFYDYPQDKKTWEIEDQYMFGPDMVVCPVLYENQREREAYLPEGNWKNIIDGQVYQGNASRMYDVPLEEMLVFVKEGSKTGL
ncbi:MAG: family 31 glucosidase, partial [Clostridiales bacterium]|nr:family 31 glucosidase [Clostridiales bacterium]